LRNPAASFTSERPLGSRPAHGLTRNRPAAGPYEFDDIDYDAESDKPQPAADSERTPEGHIVRYDELDRVIGVTIVGARDLSARMAVFAHAPAPIGHRRPVQLAAARAA